MQLTLHSPFKYLPCFVKVTCPYGSYVLEGKQVIFLHRFIEKGLGTGWANQAGQLTQVNQGVTTCNRVICTLLGNIVTLITLGKKLF